MGKHKVVKSTEEEERPQHASEGNAAARESINSSGGIRIQLSTEGRGFESRTRKTAPVNFNDITKSLHQDK